MSKASSSSEQRMADWLKMGATMLSESCPACYSPLFKLHEEIWCLRCNKRVVLVKKDEEAPRLVSSIILTDAESTVLTKIQEVIRCIKAERDIDRLQQYSQLLSSWLENLTSLRRLRSKSERLPSRE